MSKIQILAAAGLLAAGALTSCVDDNYDLSDIDTTVRVNVNDLTIPVKLDEIKLTSIIEEGERIKIVDGQYSIVEDGEFSSSEVEIRTFTVGSQTLEPTTINIPYVPIPESVGTGYYDISTNVQQFHYDANNVPEQITGIDKIGGPMQFNFVFTVNGLTKIARKVDFTDIVIQMPKGLHVTDPDGGTYSPTTGELKIAKRTISSDRFVLSVKADEIDATVLDMNFNTAAHTVSVKGDLYIKSGRIVLNSADLLPGTTPTTLQMRIDFEVPGFSLTNFSGSFKYDIEGVDISDINLDDLPDVLSQDGTNITLANPQIYLSLNNPAQKYKVTARTGLSIGASLDGALIFGCTLDNGYFTIGDNNPSGIYNFCLSPKAPTTSMAGFENAEHVPFTDLSNVLHGANRIPRRLQVRLNNPCIPDQKVEGLVLGSTIGKVNGRYKFIAPFALGQGSKITYSDEVDGWGSEDLDNLTITKLEVSATVVSEVPLALDFTGYPIDAQHRQIGNVEIKGGKLEATTAPQQIKLSITGQIRGLDGIKFVAVATAGADEKALNPNMTIKVTDIKPVVSGYFQKEL